MTTEEFELLIKKCQPHLVWKKDWGTYDSSDFASTFLPNVGNYRGTAFEIYDGAEIFANVSIALSGQMQLSSSKKLQKLFLYTYPKGVEAEKKKVNLRPEEYVICAFYEIEQNDNVEISFKFGAEFKDFLAKHINEHQLTESVSSIEKSIFKTTKSEINSFFKGELIHYNILNYFGKLLKLDLEETHKRSALILEILDIHLWTSNPKMETKGSPTEKDIIVNFEIKNQETSKYTFQVFRGKDKIFEQIFLPENIESQKLKKELKFQIGKHKIIWNVINNSLFNEAKDAVKIKFKIIAVGNEKQLSNAEKEINLKEFLSNNSNQYNNTQFDKNRVVVWLTKDFTPSKELITNSQGEASLILAGAKLIRLMPLKESLLTPCLFWWKNAYHIQEFPEELLGDTNEIFGQKMNEVFQNDVQHTAHRATFITQSNDALKSLVQNLEQMKDRQFSNDQINSAYTILKQSLNIDLENKVETLDRLVKEVRKVFDPEDHNGKMFEQILFVPLSQDWFEKYDDNIKKRYQEFWKEGNGFNSVRQLSGGGEVFHKNTTPDHKSYLDELFYLKSLLSEEDLRKKSKEWEWLEGLENLLTKNKIANVITFSLDAWNSTLTDSFASFIGLEQTFGTLKIMPLLTILLHETSQLEFQPDYLKPIPIDSHVRDLEGNWIKLSLNYSDFKDGEDPPLSDLYIANYQISTILLRLILNFMG